MFLFIKLIQSLPFKVFVLVLLVLATFSWMLNGLSWCQRRPESSAQQVIAEYTIDMARKDPQAAKELAQMRKSRDEIPRRDVGRIP